MSCIERTRYLRNKRQGMFSRERAIPKRGFEVLAFYEAHRDADPEIGLEHLIDRNNVRMIEARGELRLSPQAHAKTFVCRKVGGKKLERDRALEPQVLREVDDAHPAPPQDPLDP